MNTVITLKYYTDGKELGYIYNVCTIITNTFTSGYDDINDYQVNLFIPQGKVI